MSIEDEIVEWNIKCLPENTLTMQLEKIIEEQKELNKVIDVDTKEAMFEFADVYIAITGLRRFDTLAYYHHMSLFMWSFTILGYRFDELEPFIVTKFEKLKERIYVIENGIYRHKEIN